MNRKTIFTIGEPENNDVYITTDGSGWEVEREEYHRGCIVQFDGRHLMLVEFDEYFNGFKREGSYFHEPGEPTPAQVEQWDTAARNRILEVLRIYSHDGDDVVPVLVNGNVAGEVQVQNESGFFQAVRRIIEQCSTYRGSPRQAA